MKLITRDEARALGLKRFFTGEPCDYGHVSERYVNHSACLECNRLKSAKRRKEKPEEGKAYQAKYYAENADRKKAASKRYYEENKASCNASAKRYREERRDELNEYARQYYADNRDQLVAEKAAYRKENPEKILEANRKWREANPDLLKANWARRRHLARARMKAMCELTQLVTEEAVMLCRERYEETGIKWHLDHMLPLRSKTVSGLHVWNNLQVIPEKMNTEKHNSLTLTEPGEWFK